MAPRNISSAPSPARRWPTSFAGGGMSSETLSSCGDVDKGDDSANDVGRFRMSVPPLINKQCNACLRRTGAMRIHAF
jgi:hypothetical protein